MRKISALLRAAGEVMVDGQVERAMALLADARSTDHLIQELQSAADEGLSVVASSPFRVRHKGNLRRMVDLVDPLDRALRSTRDMAVEARPALLAVGGATGLVERTDELTAEVILAQLRSVVVDLLMLTGLDQIESTDALPPPPR